MKETKSKNGLAWKEWRDAEGLLHIELTGEGFLSDDEAAKLKAEFLTEDSFEVLLQENANVYLPREDSVLDMFAPPMSEEEDLADRLFMVFRKGALDPALCEGAYRGLKGAARASKNRGAAGGKVTPEKIGRPGAKIVPVGDGTRARYYTADGILSDTVEANVTMGGIAGFFPPTARHPYCRATAYTRDNWTLFEESWPFLQRCAALFEELNPIRYRNQTGFIKQHDLEEKGWVVPGTPYSTITVNKNFQTGVHQDAGDLKSGFENFSVLESGPHTYKGGYTVFPKFRIAFDCRHGDFVGMDVAHHWHGNTLIESAVEGEDDWERISLVMYVRADLSGAGTQAEETAKYDAWKSKHRNPVEQHEYRKGVALEERQKDADFMRQFGDR